MKIWYAVLLALIISDNQAIAQRPKPLPPVLWGEQAPVVERDSLNLFLRAFHYADDRGNTSLSCPPGHDPVRFQPAKEQSARTPDKAIDPLLPPIEVLEKITAQLDKCVDAQIAHCQWLGILPPVGREEFMAQISATQPALDTPKLTEVTQKWSEYCSTRWPAKPVSFLWKILPGDENKVMPNELLREKAEIRLYEKYFLVPVSGDLAYDVATSGELRSFQVRGKYAQNTVILRGLDGTYRDLPASGGKYSFKGYVVTAFERIISTNVLDSRKFKAALKSIPPNSHTLTGKEWVTIIYAAEPKTDELVARIRKLITTYARLHEIINSGPRLEYTKTSIKSNVILGQVEEIAKQRFVPPAATDANASTAKIEQDQETNHKNETAFYGQREVQVRKLLGVNPDEPKSKPALIEWTGQLVGFEGEFAGWWRERICIVIKIKSSLPNAAEKNTWMRVAKNARDANNQTDPYRRTWEGYKWAVDATKRSKKNVPAEHYIRCAFSGTPLEEQMRLGKVKIGDTVSVTGYVKQFLGGNVLANLIDSGGIDVDILPSVCPIQTPK